MLYSGRFRQRAVATFSLTGLAAVAPHDLHPRPRGRPSSVKQSQQSDVGEPSAEAALP